MKKFKVKPQVYKEFINQVELSNIYLKKASIEVFPEKIPKDFAMLNKIDNNVQLVEENKRKEVFEVLHIFRYKMVNKNNQDTIIAKIRFELLLTYSSGKLINKDIFDIFKVMNVPFNSWPYAREFIHSTIIRLGLPPVFLPLYK